MTVKKWLDDKLKKGYQFSEELLYELELLIKENVNMPNNVVIRVIGTEELPDLMWAYGKEMTVAEYEALQEK